MKDAFGVTMTLLLATWFTTALVDQTLMKCLQRPDSAFLSAASVFATGSISLLRFHGTHDATIQVVAALVDQTRSECFKG